MKLILVAALFGLVSCSGSNVTSSNGTYDLVKLEDKENNVLCYKIDGIQGISCIKK